jgi:tape measure domain-containing protein
VADEQYVIDITVQAIDKTSEPLAQAQKRVSEFDRAAEQTARRLQSLSRSPFDLTVRAIDRATGTMDRIYARGLSLARKPIDIMVRVKDLATAPIKSIFDLMSSYQTYIMGYVFGKVGQATIAWPLQLADNLTQASIAFQTMLHSAQKAQQFMQQVQQFAIATPFSTEDIIKNAQFLLAMGFKYQQVIPMIQAVGDAAAAVGGNADLIERILLALGQMNAKGKVQADEMLQLTEANIPAWQFLAQAMHKSVAEVQQLASKGKLEAAPAIQAIVQGMEKLYGGQMQANANKTASGLMSQISDTFRIGVVTRWGQGIQQAVIPALSEFNDWLGRNRSAVNRLGDAMYELGREGAQWVVDKLKAIAVTLSQLVNSREWQQATP